jgi:translation initiation factor IF-3
MAIAALSTSLNQSAVSQTVGIKVLSMAMNQAQTQGQDLVQLLSSGVNPNLGNKIDIKV